MSVTPGDPVRMNPLRRPRALGGVGKDPVFVIEAVGLGLRLGFHEDPRDPVSHGFVEPSTAMRLSVYRAALSDTRFRWRRWWA